MISSVFRLLQVSTHLPTELSDWMTDWLYALHLLEKTLVVGGSYIALECAGFLNGLGYDVTVLYRSEVLREFDSDVATKLKDFMIHCGVKFIKGEVDSIERQGEDERVVKYTVASMDKEVFNTVLLAIGREPNTKDIGLENISV